MGGKGGGGVAPYDQWVSNLARDPASRQIYERNRGNYGTEAEWYAAKGGKDPSPLMTPEMSGDIFTKIYGTYKPPPVQPPAPAPAAAAPPPAAPPEQPPPPPPEGGTPIDPGGAIDQPTAGDQLGGAVLNPPSYWIGGVENYNKQAKTADKGSLQTTQT